MWISEIGAGLCVAHRRLCASVDAFNAANAPRALAPAIYGAAAALGMFATLSFAIVLEALVAA